MDSSGNNDSKNVCPYCAKNYSSSSARNNHIRKIHKEPIESSRRSHILCPFEKCNCNPLGSYQKLNKHLETAHEVVLEKITLSFSNAEQYEKWTILEKIRASYALCKTKQAQGHTVIFFACSRSNTRGYQINCKKRAVKSGGSIKIKGVCPSCLIVRVYKNGERKVEFVKTHVGHDEDVQCKHLSKFETEYLVRKLKQGISKSQILADAKTMNTEGKPERINFLTRQTLNNLIKKYKIDRTQPLAIEDVDLKNVYEEIISEETASAEDEETARTAQIESIVNDLKTLNSEVFKRVVGKFQTILHEEMSENNITTTKSNQQEWFRPTRCIVNRFILLTKREQ